MGNLVFAGPWKIRLAVVVRFNLMLALVAAILAPATGAVMAGGAWTGAAAPSGSSKGPEYEEGVALGAARPAGQPLAFISNQGQWDPQVKFMAQAPAGNVFLTPSELVLTIPRPQGPEVVGDGQALLFTSLRLRFLGTSPEAVVRGERPLPQRVHYLLGDDPAGWVTGLTTYQQVVYHNLYPGIDLRYGSPSGSSPVEGALKGTYVLQPGADPALIRWQYAGAGQVALDDEGAVRIWLPPHGREPAAQEPPALIEQTPVAWQIIDGRRVPVEVSYRWLEDGSLGFALGAYDRGRPLVIDPALQYSTYLGGLAVDEAYDVAVDSARNAIVVGATMSVDFPADLPPGETLVGNRNIFVTKLQPDGQAFEFSMFIGGSGEDVARSVAVDVSGDIYLTGSTTSTDIPTTIPAFAPEESGENVFVIKLRLSGGSFRYGVVFGGSDDEQGLSLAVDGAGNAFVVGATTSTDFPTANPLQPTPGGGEMDAFVVALNAVGNELTFATYLGGSSTEMAQAVAVDRGGEVLVTGFSDSVDFPTLRPYQETLQGAQDAFLARLAPQDDGLLYSTYLGLGESTIANDILLDRDGNAYLAGTVDGALAGSHGGSDAFAVKVHGDGTALDFQMILGGSGDEEGLALGLDRQRNVYVTGFSESQDLPAEGSLQPAYGGNGDAFVAQLTAGGQLVSYNYLGGSDFDSGRGLAVFGSGDAVVAGVTFSADFPVVNALQRAYSGDGDVFVLRIRDVEVVPTPMPTATPPPSTEPPPPTPNPTGIEALVQSNLILYAFAGAVGLLVLGLGLEIIARSSRRRK